MNAAPNAGPPLEQLAPIIHPEAPGLWPLSWPAMVLLAVVLIASLAIAYWLVRRWQRQAPWRAAESQWQSLQQEDLAASDLAMQAQQLLRRLAIARGLRDKASLPPAAWADFLAQLPGAPADEQLWQAYGQAPYQAHPECSTQDILRLTESSLRSLRRC